MAERQKLSLAPAPTVGQGHSMLARLFMQQQQQPRVLETPIEGIGQLAKTLAAVKIQNREQEERRAASVAVLGKLGESIPDDSPLQNVLAASMQDPALAESIAPQLLSAMTQQAFKPVKSGRDVLGSDLGHEGALANDLFRQEMEDGRVTGLTRIAEVPDPDSPEIDAQKRARHQAEAEATARSKIINARSGGKIVPMTAGEAVDAGLEIVKQPLIQQAEGETTFQKETAKNAAAAAEKVETRGQAALNRAQTINFMTQAIDSGEVKSGLFGPAFQLGGKFLAAFGVDPESAGLGNLPATEALDAMSKSLALQLTGSLEGFSRVTNMTLRQVNDSVANLSRTPEGNKLLLELQRRQDARDVGLMMTQREFLKASGGRRINKETDQSLTDALEAYDEANPTLDDDFVTRWMEENEKAKEIRSEQDKLAKEFNAEAERIDSETRGLPGFGDLSEEDQQDLLKLNRKSKGL